MTKPKLTHAEALARLQKFSLTEPIQLLGVRGYYKKTMGNPLKNDRGIYDDAIFIVGPDVYLSFNANTDPSITRKGIANLVTGVWWYKPGKHKINSPSGYPALVQAAQVTVLRDGQGEDTGWFGINIHKGGFNTTSSLGCQTIHPTQWSSFINTVYDQLKRYNQKKVPYVLTAEP